MLSFFLFSLVFYIRELSVSCVKTSKLSDR